MVESAPHHKNEFDAVLSVTGHNTGTHSYCDYVAWMEFDWMSCYDFSLELY